MKFIKHILLFLFLIQLIACGSSQRVITKDGEVYNVNGKTIKQNGIDVTDDIKDSQRETIENLIDRKEKLEKAEEDKQKSLEKAIKEQEQIEKSAIDKQRELKDQLDALQTKTKARQDARDDYAKIKLRYSEEKKTFKTLKEKGELSKIEQKEWEAKLKKLEVEVEKAKVELDKYQ